MNTYYIFNIKEEFKNLYKNNTSSLYLILNNIKNLKYDDKGFGISFINQLTKKIEKSSLDSFLFIKMHKQAFYSKKGNIHYYSDGLCDEISNLEVMNTYIKLITNKQSSIFLEYLSKYSNDLFICDFKNTSFYFLDTNKNSCLLR